MQLMGFVDSECDGAEWQSPLSDQAATLLMTASRHKYYTQVQKEWVNNGYVYEEYGDSIFGIPDIVPQCTCVAHEYLKQEDKTDDNKTELDDLKTIIRSSSLLTMDSGANYAFALLRRIFRAMGLSTFLPPRSGTEYGVSYTLKCGGSKYAFRGHPDFVVEKEDVGAGCILVATGEVQSTHAPHVQNSIYAVGSLLRDDGKRPILCLTIFKSKMAQLAVARVTPTPTEDEAVVGSVSMKYIVTPSPMDLKTVDGLKDLAARLSHVLV